MLERRRTERLFLRIPVTVQGRNQAGQTFSEETSTVEISRDGARLGVKNKIRLGSEVQITNLLTSYSALFRAVIQCPQSYGGNPEWGFSLSGRMSDLAADFWGIGFEEIPQTNQPHISALMLCRRCGRQQLLSLTRLEYEVLRTKRALPGVCASCRVSTDWEAVAPERRKPSRPPAAGQERRAAASSGETPEDKAQRRSARRVAVHVPILVKTADGKSEQTISRDVSKGGMSFATTLDIAAGDKIEVIVGYGVVESAATQTGRVAWRRPEAKGVKALVGVQLTEPVQPEKTEQTAEPAQASSTAVAES